MGLAGGVALGAAFVGGYLYHTHTAGLPSAPVSETSFDLLHEADGLLENYFLGQIPDEETRVNHALHGMVASLEDPYTFYVEPQRHEIESTNLAGAFGGIGAEIGRDEEGRFYLATVYRDGPGYGAGLRDGDILLAVDGEEVDLSVETSDEVISAIRGPVDEPVLLTVLRGEETRDFEVIRDEITIPSVIWTVLEEDERIGYVRVTRFTASAPDELDSALDELKDQGATAFVLDLRGNGGGLVDASIKVAGMFLSGGVVAREERLDSDPQGFNASLGGPVLDQPLVVLVDGSTASASEIVAGALQDRGRARIIGQPTFGKGSVQVIQEMSNGSSLHITSARWYTPNDTPLDEAGLQPDIIVEPVEGGDAPLDIAIEELGESLTVADTERGTTGQ
jgi:carboxyl-terminal processing protease